MINQQSVTLPAAYLKKDQYAHLCYIYALLDADGKPAYVGSSTNPTSRLLAHKLYDCRDSEQLIRDLDAKGIDPTMYLLDITVRRHRLNLEAYYIYSLTRKGYTLSNTTRYRNELHAYLCNPTDFYALSNGNLDQYLLEPLPPLPIKTERKASNDSLIVPMCL